MASGQRLSAPDRARAWLIMGPLGHLYGALADWAALLGRLTRARARGTDPWG